VNFLNDAFCLFLHLIGYDNVCVCVCECLVVVVDIFYLKWWIELALIDWFLLCSGCVSFSGKLFSGKFFFFLSGKR
jgi:hypothetical protein